MRLPDAEVHASLDDKFRNGPTRWLGLSTTEPLPGVSDYSNFTEPTAASYARVQVLATEWPLGSGRGTQVEVQVPDPVEDLGVIVSWGLFLASTGGNPTVAGVPAEASVMDLQAGASDIRVTCRIEDTL